MKGLECVKWNLWHGTVAHTLQRIDDLDDDLEMLEENPANKKRPRWTQRGAHLLLQTRCRS
jgi:hypothetical protein